MTLQRVIDAVWDEAPPAAKNAALSKISRLRATLPPDALQTVPGGYRLIVARDECDADVFADRLSEARVAGNPTEALRNIEEALGLWRGDALGDLAECDFAMPTAVELNRRRRDAEEVRVRSLCDTGRLPEALAAIERLRHGSPFSEELAVLHAGALAAVGDRVEAIRALHRFQVALRDETGIEPGTAIHEAERLLLEGQDLHRLAGTRSDAGGEGSQVRAVTPALVSRHLIGRDEELGRLRECWDQTVRARRTMVVFVRGEEGIGKTALMDAFVGTREDDSKRFIRGACHAEQAIPYEPLVLAIASAMADDTQRRTLSTIEVRTLAQLGLLPAGTAPSVAEQPRGSDPVRSIDEGLSDERFQLFRGLTQFLQRLAGDGHDSGTGVLIVEDLHWATEGTCEFLKHFIRQSPVPFLIVATIRTSESWDETPGGRLLMSASRWPDTSTISLYGLVRRDVADFVDLHAPGTAPAADALLALTDGNPLFLGEILRSGVSIEPVRGVLHLPASLRDITQLRIGRVPPETRRVLQIAAVIGRDFTLRAIGGVLRATRRDILDAVEAARSVGLVHESAADGRFVFAHSVFREVLYAEIPASRRSALHASVAAELAELGPARAAAHHAILGHEFLDHLMLVELVSAAAGECLDQVEFEETNRLVHTMLVDFGSLLSPVEKLDFRLLLARSHTASLSITEGKNEAGRAFDDARALEDAPRMAQAAAIHSGWVEEGNADPRSIAMCREALDRLGHDVSDLRVELLSRMARHEATWGVIDAEVRNHAKEALRLINGAERGPSVANALWAQGLIHFALADGEAALRIAERLERATADHPRHRLDGHRLASLCSLMVGDGDRFRENLNFIETNAKDVGGAPRLDLKHWRGMEAMLDGDLERAQSWIDRQTALSSALPYLTSVHVQQAFLWREQERAADGAALLSRWEGATGSVSLAVTTFRALLHAEAGELSSATALIGDSLARFVELGCCRHWAVTMVNLAELTVHLDRGDIAATLLKKVDTMRSPFVVSSWGEACVAPRDQARGLMLHMLGRRNESEAAFAMARADAKALGAPLLAARVDTWMTRLGYLARPTE